MDRVGTNRPSFDEPQLTTQYPLPGVNRRGDVLFIASDEKIFFDDNQ